MCYLDICLIDHSIVERSVYLYMAQHLLYLLYWHTFINGHGCERASKLVRVYLGKIDVFTELPQTDFNATDSKSGIWLVKADKQCRI